MIVSLNLEASPNKVCIPSVYNLHDDNHLFFMCEFTQIRVMKLLRSEFQRVPFLYEYYPISTMRGNTFEEINHSKIWYN